MRRWRRQQKTNLHNKTGWLTSPSRITEFQSEWCLSKEAKKGALLSFFARCASSRMASSTLFKVSKCKRTATEHGQEEEEEAKKERRSLGGVHGMWCVECQMQNGSTTACQPRQGRWRWHFSTRFTSLIARPREERRGWGGGGAQDLWWLIIGCATR